MKPPLPVSVADRAMSDAMLGTLLCAFNPEPAVIHQARNAFVSYCRAHPSFKDVRSAWAAFHKELTAHMDGNKSVAAALAVTFAPAEQQKPIAITTSTHSPAPWPEFLMRHWTPKTPTAFTDDRLKLAKTDRRSVINLIATAQRMGVTEDFILDRSKYTATDLALRDIRHAILQTPET